MRSAKATGRLRVIEMKRTHYDCLQVAENASPEVIRGAFKFLAQKYHPDKNPQNPELAASKLREITEAFNTLSDPTTRAIYDRWLERQRSTNPEFERRRPQASGHRSGKAKTKRKTDSEDSTRDGSGTGVDTWV